MIIMDTPQTLFENLKVTLAKSRIQFVWPVSKVSKDCSLIFIEIT